MSAQEAERLVAKMEARRGSAQKPGVAQGTRPGLERLQQRSSASIYVTISLPAKALWPNQRGHVMVYRRCAKRYRAEAGWAARIEWRSMGSGASWKEAKVRPVFYWPDKRSRDKDNALAAIKSALDGLQDAGVIVDDAGLRPQEPVFMVDRERPRLVLEVWPVDE